MTQQQLKEKYYPLYMGARIVQGTDFLTHLAIFNLEHTVDSRSLFIALKPLSDITDEDAIEVAKVEGLDSTFTVVAQRDDTGILLSDVIISICIYYTGVIVCGKVDGAKIYACKNYIKMINELRSRHYDIDNLIEQGIAIDEKNLNK